jgi:hypothetical protein
MRIIRKKSRPRRNVSRVWQSLERNAKKPEQIARRKYEEENPVKY